MKKIENHVTMVALVISIIIVCFLLIVSIFAIVFPYSLIFYEPYYDDTEFSYYALDLTQDETDFSYKIDIVSQDGKKILTNSSYLDLERLVDNNQTDSLTVAEYDLTKEFVKQKQYYSYDCDRIPQEINFSITFSTSITYFDADEDDYLSKGDYFIIKISDRDKNEPFNLNQYYYEEFYFQIYTEDDDCGDIILNKLPRGGLDDSFIMSETVSAEGLPICPIIFITICIYLIGFQFYFLSKLFKNREDKT